MYPFPGETRVTTVTAPATAVKETTAPVPVPPVVVVTPVVYPAPPTRLLVVKIPPPAVQ